MSLKKENGLFQTLHGLYRNKGALSGNLPQRLSRLKMNRLEAYSTNDRSSSVTPFSNRYSRSSFYALLVTHYVALLLLLSTSAAEPSAAKVTFPGISVFPSEKRVEVDAKLSLDDGIVEFLLVQKAGKDYESLLVTDGKASHLKVALGLLGLMESEDELTKEGMVKSVPGNALIDGAVSVQLKWEVKGKVRTSTVEDLLIRRATKKSPPTAPWIFNGSRIRDIEGVGKVFAGDYEKALAGVWYDRSAVLNYSVRSRNPYWGDDAGFIVNKDEAPPKDTQVTVIITPWKNEDGK